jgi:hypothetical protein
VKWCDFDSHGFNIVDVTRDRIQVEYWLVDTVLERTNGISRRSTWAGEYDAPKLKKVESPKL